MTYIEEQWEEIQRIDDRINGERDRLDKQLVSGELREWKDVKYTDEEFETLKTFLDDEDSGIRGETVRTLFCFGDREENEILRKIDDKLEVMYMTF